MPTQLTNDLYAALCAVPLIDPHSHIDPLHPVSRSLDDILGYHYYTELAHSAGMSQAPLGKDVPPRQRVRAILEYMDRFDNTTQYSWFVEIARIFLGFRGDRVTAADADALFDAAERTFAQPDWEQQVIGTTKLEKIFLTNEFDDDLNWVGVPPGDDRGRIEEPMSSTNRLTGSSSISTAPRQGPPHDPSVYIPCLRTDTLVFRFKEPEVRQRLAKATGIDAGDLPTLRKAVRKLFEHFTAKGARACAISLPPDFAPTRDGNSIFWMLAEYCREFKLPFDLMIGVNRRVYEKGVFQGQDLFDQRTSLIQYRELFNAFPEVTFPISVLTSGQNQELVAYSWIFPNVVCNGHWWYSNVPAYIAKDLRERLQAVPKTKQIGYYSDAYKLEFVLPKYNMYRRVLAGVLAEDFVNPGRLSEEQAVQLGTRLLSDNVREVFRV
jgi:glucuronate isomerase